MATDSTLKTPACARSTAAYARAACRFIAELWELTKPEINLLIAITVAGSFLMAHRDWGWCRFCRQLALQRLLYWSRPVQRR